ncbi:MAG: shikimate kinase [Phycisphaerales bacterium]
MSGSPSIVALIGPRGSGKTTLGRRVAEALGWRFVDLDEAALEVAGVTSVRAVWDRGGEAAWREAETTAFAATLDGAAGDEDPLVLALGGGAPLVPAIGARMRAEAASGRMVIVYLECRPETLRSRLRGGTEDRPSLTGADPLDEIEAVLARREPAYRDLATAVISGDDRSIDNAVAAILATVRNA